DDDDDEDEEKEKTKSKEKRNEKEKEKETVENNTDFNAWPKDRNTTMDQKCVVQKFSLGRGDVHCVRFSPSGRHLAAGGDAGVYRIYERKENIENGRYTFEMIHERFIGHSVTQLAWVNDHTVVCADSHFDKKTGANDSHDVLATNNSNNNNNNNNNSNANTNRYSNTNTATSGSANATANVNTTTTTLNDVDNKANHGLRLHLSYWLQDDEVRKQLLRPCFESTEKAVNTVLEFVGYDFVDDILHTSLTDKISCLAAHPQFVAPFMDKSLPCKGLLVVGSWNGLLEGFVNKTNKH
ncbi:hypothetical protein RFI_19819, partial [Reticulomyxa filosa]